MIHTARQTAKFVKLMRRLRTHLGSAPVDAETIAVGILERLWHMAINSAKRGDVGQHDNEVIAESCGWIGEPDDLILMLIDCGWLDESDQFRLVIHDWHEHAPAFLRRNIDKLGGFASTENGRPVSSSVGGGDASEPPTGGQKAVSEATTCGYSGSVKSPLERAKSPLNDTQVALSPHLTCQNTPQVLTPNLTKPNQTKPPPPTPPLDWGGVEGELRGVGLGQHRQAIAALQANGLTPQHALTLIEVWRGRQHLFRQPVGALYQRLLAAAPGMAADTGWVADPPDRSKSKRARDPTLELEMRRAQLVRELREAGRTEDEIEAAEAKLLSLKGKQRDQSD